MTSPVMTGQDYIQRMRERRQARYAGDPATQTPDPEQPQLSTQPEVQLTQEVTPVPLSPTPEFTQQSQAVPPQDFVAEPPPFKEEVLLEWEAPSRPFKKRNARFYTTITVIVVLISLILFFAGQFLPIAAVVAVAFLGYVLASVPPEVMKYQLSTAGIRIENNFYLWDEMGAFWMDKKYGQEFIHIEVPRFPFRLTIMLGELPPDEMQLLLSQILPEQTPTLTYMDKIAHWLEKNVLLDDST